MSTDEFTKAARKRAERRVPLDGGEPDLIFRDRRELVEMAEWARDYLAAQEPTDAEVEAADRGRVEHNIRRRMTDAEWAATRSRVEHEAMRAALVAARAARRDKEKR